MTEDPSQALGELIRRWGVRYRNDPEFRADLDLLAVLLREVTTLPLGPVAGLSGDGSEHPREPRVSEAGEEYRTAVVETESTDGAAAPRAEPSPSEPITADQLETLRNAILGTARRAPITADGKPVTADRRSGAHSDEDLQLIEKRCSLKAEGCRWAAERVRRMEAGLDYATDIEPYDREIIRRAKEIPDCYLWMNTPDGPIPTNLVELDDIADAFDACASALSVARRLFDDVNRRDQLETALHLVAEAQSALRTTIQRIGARDDEDQRRIHFWLRDVADRERIFISRYMRIDDPADPRRLPELVQEIDALEASVSEAAEQSRKRKASLNTIRYHLRQVERDQATLHDWRRIDESIAALLELGMPRSHPELRNLFLPFVDRIPDELELGPGTMGVLQEIDRYLSTRSTTVEAADRVVTPEVEAARRLLEGRSVVVIGGVRRPASQEAIREALGLAEVHWPDTREHQSIEPFAPLIAKDDVAVVLLAIRWSSHSFGDVKIFCDRHGKPLVRLPRGYNPGRVAAEILAQASDALRRAGNGRDTAVQ